MGLSRGPAQERSFSSDRRHLAQLMVESRCEPGPIIRRYFANALGLAVLIACSAGAQTIWTGHTLTFEKTAFADEALPENQDRITDSVWITRAATQGIFNIAQEETFSSNTSPIGTEWAFQNNNPTATLSATNWQALVFEDWQTANGGGGGGPPNTVGQDAVLHLVAEDIYLDIRFTSWGVGPTGGGSFSYIRAEPPEQAVADFNNDGIVDAADYVMWRKDQNVGTYADWVQQFGVVIPGSGGTAVPEPRAATLLMLLLACGASALYRPAILAGRKT